MYLVIYNTKYDRQFEAVVPHDAWDRAKLEYGAAGAVHRLVKEAQLKKRGRTSTSNRAKSLGGFLDGMMVAPHIYGIPVLKVGNTKKEVLDRGLGEFRIYSTRRGIKTVRRHHRKGGRKRYDKLHRRY
jgi:hypothetical protein